jgi:DNA mismatch repair protein MutS
LSCNNLNIRHLLLNKNISFKYRISIKKLNKIIMIIEDYIKYQDQYEEQFGERTIFLMEVGSFFEYYGIIKVPEGKTEQDMSEEEKIQNRWGRVWDVADNVLSAHISRRGNWAYKPYMAGFPNHAIEKHIALLVEASYTVVTMRQKEYGVSDPERYIDIIHSPGLNTSNLTYESNYLASIYIEPFSFYGSTKTGLSIGLSFLDVSTGNNKIFETTSKQEDILYSIDETYRLLQSHRPQEVIIYVGDIQKLSGQFGEQEHIRLTAESSLTQEFLIKTLELYKTTYHFRRTEPKHKDKTYQNEILARIFENENKMIMVEYLNLMYYTVGLKAYICMLDFAYIHGDIITKKIRKPSIITDKKKLILNHNSIQQLEIIADKNKTYAKETKYDSLISILSKCRTSMGKRLFRERLCQPITDIKILQKRYDQIEYFRTPLVNNDSESVPRYRRYEAYLASVGDLERYHRNVQMGDVLPSTFCSVHRSYTSIDNLMTEMGEDMDLFFDKTLVKQFRKFREEYMNIFDLSNMYNLHRDKIYTNIFRRGIHDELDKLQGKMDAFNNLFKLAADELSTYIHDPRNKKNELMVKIDKNETDGKYLTCTKRRGEFLKTGLKNAGNPTIDIKASEHLTVSINSLEIEYKKRKNVTTINVHSLTNIATQLNASQHKMTAKCIKLFRSTLYDLMSDEKYRNCLDHIVKQISSLDITISAAKASLMYKYCKPTIGLTHNNNHNHNESDSSTVTSTVTSNNSNNSNIPSYVKGFNVRHPIIERINDELEYIPNDVDLSPDNVAGILLYGCNMCGKSSYMKSIGLNIIMAQAGMYVAAEEFDYYPYDFIFTRISGNDNIFKNQSSFAVEMHELRNILKRTNHRSLILGDELCRGTESISGKAIVAAGVCKLREYDSQFIFATHLHGLSEIPEIKALSQVKAYHLAVEYDREKQRLIYDRHMKEGSGSSLYGLEVCRAMDMDEDFLELANRIRMREIGEHESLLGDEKKSQYNNDIYMLECSICNKPAEETHHIKYQKDADDNNFVGHVYKNNKSNLAPLCKECHKKETYGKIDIVGWKDTSDGRKLEVIDLTASELDATINSNKHKCSIEISEKIIAKPPKKHPTDAVTSGDNSKVKGFKNLLKREYDYVFEKIKEVVTKCRQENTKIKARDLLEQINEECPSNLDNFVCTKHIMNKIRKQI